MELDDLKTMQAAFDRSRGFADLPFLQAADGAPRPDAVDRMQFALMGLIGEVGEAASLLKKVIRGRVSSGNVALDEPAFAEELADVFAYLLKLADAGEIDFARSYLEKMARNAHRFAARSATPAATIAISGPPGSGKTSVIAALNERGRSAYLEEFQDNPYLGDIQVARANFDAAASQNWFLDQIGAWVRARPPGADIFLDQDPTAIVLVYSRLLLDRGALDRDAYVGQLTRLLALETECAPTLAARTVVILDAPVDELARRCEGKFAGNADAAFLRGVRERFFALFDTLPHVHVVDAAAPLEQVVDEVVEIASRDRAARAEALA